MKTVWFMLFMVLLLMLNKPAHAEEWTATNKLLFGGFVAANVADALQTRKIDEGSGYVEKNEWLYGKYPSDGRILAVKAATVGGMYWLVKDADPVTRNLALILGTIVVGSAVAGNLSIGLSIGF